MSVIHQIPPIYYKLKAAFGVDWDNGVVITYGDNIYAKHDIPDDLLVHESIHIAQQKMNGGPEVWWERYIHDVNFRLTSEIEAYNQQMKFIRKNVKDRNKVVKYQDRLARDMASMYGEMCTYSQAYRYLSL